jgi:sporulation protein YlmC with PRC-barrel domain
MIALIDVELNQSQGKMTFEITEPIAVETIVPDSSIASQTLMFKEGATIEGFPSQGFLSDTNGQPIQNVEGVLVEHDGGHLIIPFEKVREVGDKIISEVESGLDKVDSAITKEVGKDTVLGFTYKQLLFIGLITIVVVKVVK